MDKKRGYNIKYLLLFSSAAALLCALAAYISINDTYKYTRERAAFLAESYGSQTRYELMDLYDDAFVLRELIQQGMLDAKGTKIAVELVVIPRRISIRFCARGRLLIKPCSC